MPRKRRDSAEFAIDMVACGRLEELERLSDISIAFHTDPNWDRNA